MTKRALSAGELFELRQALHVATLDALMASRRWTPGDLVFQGGTSLHLAHGSPRFSEDLDFLVKASLRLDALATAMQRRLDGMGWLPVDLQVAVKPAKAEHNPHALVVTASGPQVIGSVRVKVELWRAADEVVSGMKAVVTTIQLARGPGSGMAAFVPSAELGEIHADKVFALAARPYLKPRDVFDLHWLDRHAAGPWRVTPEQMAARLATYPGQAGVAWVAQAVARREALLGAGAAVATDLARWLPSSWPLDAATVDAMLTGAGQALEQGVAVMREVCESDLSTGMSP